MSNMSLKRIKLVTFDATNTLLKFKVPPWQHYANVAQGYGFKGTADSLKSRLLASYKVMWNEHPNFGKHTINWELWWHQVVKLTFEGQLPAKTDVDSIACRLINEFKTSKCWIPAQGGDKLLHLIRDQGITIGVISNFDPRLNDILQNVSIHDKFDFVLTSYDIGYSKPDERVFKHAIEVCKSPVKPSESLHIGDNVEKDYEGARAAGWHALLVNENLIHEKPPAIGHVFKDLEELNRTIELDKLKL